MLLALATLTRALPCRPATHTPCSEGRFGGKLEAEGGCVGPGGKVDAPELSSGPACEMQEVSRVGAQGVTSKSKLLAREMPDLHTGGLRVDSGAARWWKGARAGQRVDRRRSYASSGPGWKIQEVSRVGAQGVTSKSKLLALEMLRVCKCMYFAGELDRDARSAKTAWLGRSSVLICFTRPSCVI